MDKNEFLIALSESDKTDFGRIEFSDQSEDQKVFSAIWELESQVMNGGFGQYFSNWGGDTASYAPLALERIGALKCAAIVREALQVVSGEPLASDHTTRSSLVSTLGEPALARLDALDSQFFEYPDNLTELLYEFVRQHPQQFGPVE